MWSNCKFEPWLSSVISLVNWSCIRFLNDSYQKPRNSIVFFWNILYFKLMVYLTSNTRCQSEIMIWNSVLFKLFSLISVCFLTTVFHFFFYSVLLTFFKIISIILWFLSNVVTKKTLSNVTFTTDFFSICSIGFFWKENPVYTKSFLTFPNECIWKNKVRLFYSKCALLLFLILFLNHKN